MKLNYKLLAAGAGLLIAGWLILGPRSGTLSGQQSAPPVPVTAALVSARDVPLNLVGIGTVQAYNTVTMRARVDGELMDVAFTEGQDVKKGDVLARIDPRPYQAALDNATATLAKDKAALENAERDLGRYKDTAAKGYSSRQQLDTQSSAVESLTATVQADMANIESAKVQLGYTTIAAPLDGVTGIRLIDQGNLVHASDTTGLVVITQLQPISAIFTLPQSALPQIAAARDASGRDGGKLVVTALDADGGTELDQGALTLVDNQIDPATGSIKLKASFPNEKRTLWPGQFVNIRLRVGAVHDGVTVPTRVVQRGPHGFFAFVIKPDNTVEMRTVETGQEDRGQVLITKGLSAGERVVTDGQLRLQPGATVQATEDKTADAGATDTQRTR